MIIIIKKMYIVLIKLIRKCETYNSYQYSHSIRVFTKNGLFIWNCN